MNMGNCEACGMLRTPDHMCYDRPRPASSLKAEGKCEACDGRGWFLQNLSVHVTCQDCSGTGRAPQTLSQRMRDRGIEPRTRARFDDDETAAKGGEVFYAKLHRFDGKDYITTADYDAKVAELKAALAQRDAEVERLRGALDKFGWHHFRCEALTAVEMRDPDKACTCGYDAALTLSERK